MLKPVEIKIHATNAISPLPSMTSWGLEKRIGMRQFSAISKRVLC